jgi:hypothetical protein
MEVPSAALPHVRVPRTSATLTSTPSGSVHTLARPDHDLDLGRRVVGDQVVVRAAGEGDVAGVEAHLHGGGHVDQHEGPVGGGDQAQRRLVLDLDAERRLHDHPEEEGAAGPGAVEQRRDGIHARTVDARVRMCACGPWTVSPIRGPLLP